MNSRFFEEFFSTIGGPQDATEALDREALNTALSSMLGSEKIDVSQLEDEEAATIFIQKMQLQAQQESITDVMQTLGGSVQELAEALNVHLKTPLKEATTTARNALIFS